MTRCSVRTVFIHLAFVALAFFITSRTPAAGQDADLWDISRGIVITSHSPTLETRQFDPFSNYFSDILNMFGGHIGIIERFDSPNQPTFFEDHFAPGYVHFVEWRTQDPMLLKSIQLWAVGDGSGRANDRDFARFTLYARNPATGMFVKVYELVPPHPEATVTLPLNFTLPSPIAAQDFRAEFVQYTTPINEGPRIFRLSGFGTFVGGPSKRIPKVSVEKFLTSQWEYVFPFVNRTGIWGLKQYAVVRNFGNAPAYLAELDGATYGSPIAPHSAITFTPDTQEVTVSTFFPLPLPFYAGLQLEPGHSALVILEYDIPGGGFPIIGFPNLYPYALGVPLPLRIVGSYYTDGPDPLFGFTFVPSAQFTWSLRNVPTPTQ